MFETNNFKKVKIPISQIKVRVMFEIIESRSLAERQETENQFVTVERFNKNSLQGKTFESNIKFGRGRAFTTYWHLRHRDLCRRLNILENKRK